MHYDFFLSHCREDKIPAAFPLYNALQHMGFSVWIDRKEIVTGDLIFRNIEAAIQNSTCVIALIAPPYLDRTWTKRELQLTLELEQAPHSNKKLFPIYHHTCHEQVVNIFPALQERAYETLHTDEFDPATENSRSILDRAVLWFFSNGHSPNGLEDIAWLEHYQHLPPISQLLMLCRSYAASTGHLRTELIEHTNILRYLLAILSDYEQPHEAGHRQKIARKYCQDIAARCFDFHASVTYDMLLVCRAMMTVLFNDLQAVLDAIKDS